MPTAAEMLCISEHHHISYLGKIFTPSILRQDLSWPVPPTYPLPKPSLFQTSGFMSLFWPHLPPSIFRVPAWSFLVSPCQKWHVSLAQTPCVSALAPKHSFSLLFAHFQVSVPVSLSGYAPSSPLSGLILILLTFSQAGSLPWVTGSRGDSVLLQVLNPSQKLPYQPKHNCNCRDFSLQMYQKS